MYFVTTQTHKNSTNCEDDSILGRRSLDRKSTFACHLSNLHNRNGIANSYGVNVVTGEENAYAETTGLCLYRERTPLVSVKQEKHNLTQRRNTPERFDSRGNLNGTTFFGIDLYS